MRKFLAFAAAMVAISTTAQAADLPVKAMIYSPTPLHSWTGFYVGVSVGAVQNTATWNEIDSGSGCITDACSGTFKLEKTGFIGGGHAGYNWQSGSFLFGIEGDISGVSADVSRDWRPGRNHRAIQGSTIDWLSTIRGRAGLTVDNTLVYVTGGVAFASMKNTVSMTFPTATIGQTVTRAGWVAGGGVEHAFTPNWTGRAEVLYVNLGNEDATGAWRGAQIENFANTLVVGRVGASYRFW